LLDEWTCFSDVGDSVTLEEYQKVEQAYIDSATEFAQTWSDSSVTITGLEDHDRNTHLKEGQTLEIKELAPVLRSILRNEFWCRLEAKDGFIHFSWDYYMYVGVSDADENLIKKANQRELFVEPCTSSQKQ